MRKCAAVNLISRRLSTLIYGERKRRSYRTSQQSHTRRVAQAVNFSLGIEPNHDLDRRESVTAELVQAGFKEPARAYDNLVAVRDGEVYAPPSTKRLRIMRTLGPALVDELTRSSDPDQALFNLAKFSHSIGGRTGFLTLLAENPKTLHLLITLFAESQFLTDLFLNRPELIDTLIRVDLTHVTKNREQMLGEMHSALSQCDDTESKLNALRRYKNEEFIRIGLHDLGGAIDLLETLHQLSDLADASLQAVLDVTLAELNKNYGAVPHGLLLSA